MLLNLRRAVTIAQSAGASHKRNRIAASFACMMLAIGLAHTSSAQETDPDWIPFDDPAAEAEQAETEAAQAESAPAPSKTSAASSMVGASSFSGTGKNPWDEYDKQVQGSGVIGTLGPDLFGDQVEFYKNTLSFSVTDISLPGNFPLPVALTRNMTVSDRYAYDGNRDGPLQDWDLDIPNISGVYGPTWEDDRCSFTGVPDPTILYQTDDFWNGLNASMPGGGELLRPIIYDPAFPEKKAAPKPTNGVAYPWMTPGLTYIRCVADAPGIDAVGNATGEGFEAITSDGTTYTFGWMAQNFQPELRRPKTSTSQGDTAGYAPLERRLNTMYVTRIEDRFGNSVNYTYDNASTASVRLRRIEASDGRVITFEYTGGTLTNGTQYTGGTLASAAAHGRTWTYQYALGSLSAVILPDTSRWTYAFNGLAYAVIEPDLDPNTPRSCNMVTPWIGGGGTGTVTHPSGAIGSFTVMPARHGRTNVPKFCHNWSYTSNNPNDDIAVLPKTYDVLSITRKAISGPGLTPYEWLYTGGSFGKWAPEAYEQGYQPVCQTTTCLDPPACVDDSCEGTHITSVSGREVGTTVVTDFQRITFGNSYKRNEGKLIKIERGRDSGSILETETYGYELAHTGQEFATPIGTSLQTRAAGFASEYVRPQSSKIITRDAVNFTSATVSFDEFVRPLVVERYNDLPVTPRYFRRDTTDYREDDRVNWVVGQVEQSKTNNEANTAEIIVSETSYYEDSDLPMTVKSFGLPQYTLDYYANGTLKNVTDANLHVTQFANWKGGVPQAMTLADNRTLSAVVNDSSWITQVTDEMGTVTAYGHDPMGRLALTDYTNVDTVAWNSTTRSFAPMPATDYDLYKVPLGSWKQIVGTGNGRTSTWYNARWQPVLVLTEDTANSATRSFVVTRYDANGRVNFQTYPVATMTNIASALPGIATEYDGLGRVTHVKQDSERAAAPVLVTKTEYLAGFQTRVTNPRLFVTTTEYQAYDTPTTEAPVKIIAPETQTTTIVRDRFLKPTSITRSGTFASAGVSATRHFVFDVNQRLCKTIEPESGSTFTNYDAAGNVWWTAAGHADALLTCNRGVVPVAAKTIRTYDQLNRLLGVDVADSVNDLDYEYYADGALKSVENGNAAKKARWDYAYNLRGMPKTETLTFGGLTRTLLHEYNTNGFEHRLTYPSGQVINTVPNALGQATLAATYATGVTYFPNGGMSGFTYGNGIVHAMTPNLRGLPLRSLDQKPGQASMLDDTYSYDENGNVLSIVDATGASYGSTRQNITYDALDRLTAVDAPGQTWIEARITYDPLDNLRTHKSGLQNWTYAYDAPKNRLASINNTVGGSLARAIVHDDRGNIVTNGASTYLFDAANRMTEVVGKEKYFYDGHGRRVEIENAVGALKSYPMYSLDGKLVADLNLRDPLDQVHEYYYLNGSQVARRYRQNVTGASWTTRYVHTDSLGSGVVETKPDASYSSVTKYEPYGEPNTLKQGPGYTGHVTDAATGLSYMQQRYYDPQLGRFLSVDPMAVDTSNAFNFNRYNYAANNPYRFKDPDGRVIDTVVDAGFLIYDGGRFLGAVAAAAVGAVTGDEALTNAGLEGMSETGGDAGMSAASIVIPGVSAPMLRGVDNAVDASRSTRAGQNGVEGPAHVETRTTRAGEPAAKITYPDSSVKDVSPSRVKEFVPNRHPNAPPGAQQRVVFDNAQPGTKGYKRDPTPDDLKEAGITKP